MPGALNINWQRPEGAEPYRYVVLFKSSTDRVDVVGAFADEASAEAFVAGLEATFGVPPYQIRNICPPTELVEWGTEFHRMLDTREMN